ncbi:MAG: hypothetical protein OEU95_09190 [Nitrospirota bacterium]|nr:hypothetical protein [Nitrospirota bacterium]
MANRQNYAVIKELKRQKAAAAGLVSERFPSVSDIMINMTYFQKSGRPVLMVRTVNIVPASYALFNMDCMIRGCDGGGFDLSSVVSDMVKAHKKVKKGAIACQGNIDKQSSEHASIEYEAVITYK